MCSIHTNISRLKNTDITGKSNFHIGTNDIDKKRKFEKQIFCASEHDYTSSVGYVLFCIERIREFTVCV